MLVTKDLTDQHHGYRLEHVARSPKLLHAARCSCGWRSEPYPTAGMAGTAFDMHVVEVER